LKATEGRGVRYVLGGENRRTEELEEVRGGGRDGGVGSREVGIGRVEEERPPLTFEKRRARSERAKKKR